MGDLLWIPILAGALTAGPQPAAPVAPPPPDRPITRMVQNLGTDLTRLAHVDSAVLLGVGGAIALVTHRQDDNVDRWTVDNPAGDWTAVGRIGGDGWIQGGAALATWGVGRWQRDALTTHVGSDLIRAQMLNMVTTRVLKIAIDRTRPSGGGHALPSGHASATFTTAGVLHRHLGWKVAVPAYAAAGFVSYTRVRDRMHWVSDTIVGAALGLTAAWTVTRGHDQHDWTITPVASATSAGVVIRW